MAGVSDQAALESYEPAYAFKKAPSGMVKDLGEIVSFLNDPKNRKIVSEMNRKRNQLKEAVLEHCDGEILESGGTIAFKDAGEITISHTKYAERPATPERTTTRIGIKGHKAVQTSA